MFASILLISYQSNPYRIMLVLNRIVSYKQLTCLHRHPHAEHVQPSHFPQSRALFRIFFCLASHIPPASLQWQNQSICWGLNFQLPWLIWYATNNEKQAYLNAILHFTNSFIWIADNAHLKSMLLQLIQCAENIWEYGIRFGGCKSCI